MYAMRLWHPMDLPSGIGRRPQNKHKDWINAEPKSFILGQCLTTVNLVCVVGGSGIKYGLASWSY